MNKDSLKSLIYNFGKLLGLLGLIFVIYKLTQEYTIDSFIEKLIEFKIITLPLIALNLISSIIGIYAWHLMLQSYSHKIFSPVISYYYFAKTEISKYLPGNIFHFISRQALSSKLGLSQKEMAKTSLLFMLIIATSTLISATIFAFASSNLEFYLKVILLISSISTIGLILFSYPSITKNRKLLMLSIVAISISLQGILLATIVAWQLDNITLDIFFKVTSIYILSWLIGFITPGASGGLGVREGAFITIAKFVHLGISSEIIIFSIFFIRFINILIDIIMYISTFFIKSID